MNEISELQNNLLLLEELVSKLSYVNSELCRLLKINKEIKK